MRRLVSDLFIKSNSFELRNFELKWDCIFLNILQFEIVKIRVKCFMVFYWRGKGEVRN